jgi:hypothetical protein
VKYKRVSFVTAFVLAIAVSLNLGYLSYSIPNLVSSVKQAPITSEWEVVSQLNPKLLQQLARSHTPDSTGAIGRNQPSYQSVTFQRYTAQRVIYGLLTHNLNLIEQSILAMEYAFAHQSWDGSFAVSYSNARRTAKTVAVASDVAGFYSDFGRSLLLLQQSDWFTHSQETGGLQTRLQRLIPLAKVSLAWLVNQANELKTYHQATTNLLFLDATAYYLTGQALANPKAVQLGEQFTQFALSQQDPSGFFLEKGGYDTSYQGVSLDLALSIYTHVSQNEKALRDHLWKGIVGGVKWQLKYIGSDGQISTVGNSRVYSGGEKYFNREKGIDYPRTINALLYYAQIAKDQTAKQAADRMALFKRIL